MKRILKIGGISLLVIILLLAVLPFLFKGKVKEAVVTAVNDMLDAEFYMGDLSMNFFSNFPNASVSIDQVGLIGKEDSQGDTLANVGKVKVVIDLSSLLKETYVINSVEVIDPTLHAKVNEQGAANWDILKSDEEEDEVEESTGGAIQLALDKLIIENLCATYDDRKDSMSASADHLNLNLVGDLALDTETLANIKTFNLAFDKVQFSDEKSVMTVLLEKAVLDISGKMSGNVADIRLGASVDSTSLSMGSIPYLNKAKTQADITLSADLDNDKYTFGENSISLNEIVANFSGFVQLLDSSAIDMDLAVKTPNIDFKQILSLIPAIYAQDFASLKTSGEVSLAATAKGRMAGDTLPAFNADLNIKNAMFKYPDLPSSVNGINITANISNPGNITDSTTLNVEKLALNMAGNPFEVKLFVKTPISDPDFKFATNGTIDFGKISQVVKLENMKLNGILTAALKANGKMSYVDKEQYDRFSILGSLNLKDFVMKAKSIDYDVNVNNANMDFNSQNVNLAANLSLGKSDLSLVGKLQNFLQYVVRGETIKGSLDVKSNCLNVTELIGESSEEAPAEATQNTSAQSVIDIPANIEFALNTNIAKLIYEGIEISDLQGNLSLKEKCAKIQNLAGNALGGNFNVKGDYNVQDTLAPKVDLELGVNSMKISEVFSKVTTAKKIAPMLSDADGYCSMNLNFDSKLDHAMSPNLSTVNGKGKFVSKEVGLKAVKALGIIAEKVNYDPLKNPKIKDINIQFVIKDGRLEINPFETAIQTALLKVSGSSGLDQTLDYITTVSLQSITDKIPVAFDVKIGGTFSSPKVTVGAASTVEAIKEKVTEKVTEVVDKAKEKAIAIAKEQKEKMVADAQKQRDKLIEDAEKAGNKLVEEAKNNAKKMEEKAANPLAKKAAQKTGEASVKRMQEQAAKMKADATAAGDKLIQNAEKNGDALISKASAAGSTKTAE